MKELICITCPRGCHLQVDEETFAVTGNFCKRGEVYGANELKNPIRVITSTVKIKNAIENRLPVKTDKPISKAKMMECVKLLDTVEICSPVHRGDIILANVLGTDVNIIATKDM